MGSERLDLAPAATLSGQALAWSGRGRRLRDDLRKMTA